MTIDPCCRVHAVGGATDATLTVLFMRSVGPAASTKDFLFSAEVVFTDAPNRICFDAAGDAPDRTKVTYRRECYRLLSCPWRFSPTVDQASHLIQIKPMGFWCRCRDERIVAARGNIDEERVTDSIDMNEQSTRETVSNSQSAGMRPPRVWTVFAALGVALLLSILLQAGLGAVVAITELSRGAEPEELGEVVMDRLTSPYAFMLMIAAGQLAFGMAGFLPALWSPLSFRERVDWKKARPSRRVYPLSMLGSIVPLAIGLAAAEALTKVIPADQSLLKFFDALTIDSAIVFVLFVGIAPGVCEEVLFRGYMQQRLTKRWGAVTGIVITSILFALLHTSPHAILAVFLLGFWFGYVAWRSKSILPAVMCHFFVNSGINAWRMIVKFGELSDTAQNTVQACSLLIGVVCFAVCFWPGFWREHVEADQQAITAEFGR